MNRAAIALGACATVLGLLALAAGYRALEREVRPAAAIPSAIPPGTAPTAEEAEPATASREGFLYGRITTVDGASYEGRLRWGGGQEAFWGDYFNGAKRENPWVAQVPPERLRAERRAIEVFGLKIGEREIPIDFGRPFMARFGDIARLEVSGRDVRVTLKSGTAFDLDRFEASDFDDGVRVWEGARGGVDFDSLQIRTIELLPAPALGDAPARLHGTVRTAQGDFTGFLQWNREEGVGTDELHGRTADGEVGLRFDTIRSIARRAPGGVQVALSDGRDLVLSGGHEVGEGQRGIYVDDDRYGRVLVSWDAFERVDFD
ncbi:MAG: hypothetical protein K8H90_04960, partial [Thermoanaerobaculia bacterium]|nr:hypothetical protein [Thermoanaerobaculia bacterium]